MELFAESFLGLISTGTRCSIIPRGQEWERAPAKFFDLCLYPLLQFSAPTISNIPQKPCPPMRSQQTPSQAPPEPAHDRFSACRGVSAMIELAVLRESAASASAGRRGKKKNQATLATPNFHAKQRSSIMAL